MISKGVAAAGTVALAGAAWAFKELRQKIPPLCEAANKTVEASFHKCMEIHYWSHGSYNALLGEKAEEKCRPLLDNYENCSRLSAYPTFGIFCLTTIIALTVYSVYKVNHQGQRQHT